MLARDVMTTRVITIDASASIGRAIRLMIDNQVSGLPVMDDQGRVCGVITEGDLLGRCEIDSLPPISETLTDSGIHNYIRNKAWRIADIMTPNIVAVSPDTPVSIVAKLMAAHNIKRILVLDHGHLIGLVSRHDLLIALTETRPDIIASGDEALRLAIATRLKSELGLNNDRISVAVQNAQVSITGTIDSELQRQAIKVLVERISGTSGLVDGLQVASQTA
jgi:CBS domain-containing protein